MELEYATRELEKTCTDERAMQKKLGVQVAKTLKLRIAELRRAVQMDDLLLGTGRWEQMTADRAGEWSARLTANWRLIVAVVDREIVTVLVLKIEDYHRR